MKLISPTISRFARIRSWRMEQWMTDPIATQRDVLQDLVTHGQFAEIGRQYGFKNLFSIRDFKKSIPIVEYDAIKPFIDRMMKGENNLLWNTPVNWFAKSSGTTSDKSKFIPITNESLNDCHYQAAKDVLTMYYNFNPDSDLLTGRGLVIGGSHQMSVINDDIQYGDLSAVLLQNAPVWSSWIRTPDLSIALLDEWENKLEQLAQSTIEENVTSISGVPTWTMLLIRRVLEMSGKDTLKEVWPNLELYIHGGVSFLPYREQFKKLIGEDIHFMEIYNASEGFFAAQDSPDADGMLLLLEHGIFYEFMPIEEYGRVNPITIGLKDVQIGAQYALVISTNGGLWRYLVGDTIQFTTAYPFRIKVTGRVKHFINTFGEEVMVDNTDRAIAAVCKKMGVVVLDYTVGPVFFSEGTNGCHEWLIAFENAPQNLNEFGFELDVALKSVNSDYEAKRHKDIALRCPIIKSLPKDTFNKWLYSKGKMGGQHKIPRLSNDRKLIEEILSFAELTQKEVHNFIK